ncbi:hypothetical protein ACIF6I_33990 [Streptomyces microflavus]|uniref:hypothetical protein n=1 Tax=Streptomyces microflavus TaxID=1919 RepID=UPI0037D28EAC
MLQMLDDQPSQFAVYIRGLDAGHRQTLQIDDSVLVVVEVVVALCHQFCASSDGRPWADRLADALSDEQRDELGRLAADFTEVIQSGALEQWQRRLRQAGFQGFAKRLLGAAEYRSAVDALKADGAVVALALRRLLRSLAPYAAAWTDMVGAMSPDQVRALKGGDALAANGLHMLVQLDAFLGEKVLGPLPMETTRAAATDLASWKEQDLEEMARRLRLDVSSKSVDRVGRSSATLVRKLRGARAALRLADDGISQAANSLVELLDRMMREAFPPPQVLAWIDANLPDEPDLTHTDKEGVVKPTKYGEALCFFFGGAPIPESYDAENGANPQAMLIPKVFATVLRTARNRLSKIKHTDAGTAEEREAVVGLMTAVEAALLLGLTVGGPRSAEAPPGA